MRNVCLSSMSVCAVATLLTGCVPGYNSMLFATKTNAALVLDTQTPEVTVDIGRQEGLLAPTYEAGKTPPVMASFRFDSGGGFLANYIGSAFTTGDAAVAMSRLYDAPDWERLQGQKVWDLSKDDWKKDVEPKFDSGVDLYLGEPKMPWFVPKEEAGAVRPVLFGTDTAFGFKMAWKNPETPYPDYIRLGFQRRELAFAAVTVGPDVIEKEGTAPDGTPAPQPVAAKPWLVARAPSLLATVDANVQAGKFLNSGFSYLQYFSSGSAATALALRNKVRQAMLQRFDPEAAKKSNPASTAFAGETVDIAIQTLVVMHSFFDERAKDNSMPAEERALAARHVASLDSIGRLTPQNWPFTSYRDNNTNATPPIYEENPNIVAGTPTAPILGTGFRRITTYWGALNTVEEKITEIVSKPTVVVNDAAGAAIPNAKTRLESELKTIRTERQEFGEIVIGSSAVREARVDFCKRFVEG